MAAVGLALLFVFTIMYPLGGMDVPWLEAPKGQTLEAFRLVAVMLSAAVAPLAAFVAFLAYRTSQLAVATSQASLSTQIRPRLVDVSKTPGLSHPIELQYKDGPLIHDLNRSLIHGSCDETSDPSAFYVSVPVRNVGSGVAVIERVSLRVGHPPVSEVGRIMKRNVPAKEISRAYFTIRGPSDVWTALKHQYDKNGHVAVEVTYTDFAEGQRTYTQIDVRNVFYDPDITAVGHATEAEKRPVPFAP